jgi:hypothetical protein
MKKPAFLSSVLALVLASTANAQLSMQMNNGWNFTFRATSTRSWCTRRKTRRELGADVGAADILRGSGTAARRSPASDRPPPRLRRVRGQGPRGSTDLGVTFGFAPQIPCGDNGDGGVARLPGQIDMRQVFMTVGGGWGTFKFGRDIGVFNRTNILTDQTLYGVGATGGQVSGGTTLAGSGSATSTRISYPSSPSARPAESPATIGLFDPSANNEYITTTIPRLETEFVWTNDQTKVWVGGLLQSTKTPETFVPTGAETATSRTAWSGGVKFGTEKFSVLGSGFWGSGIGTTLLFDVATDGTGQAVTACATRTDSSGRPPSHSARGHSQPAMDRIHCP